MKMHTVQSGSRDPARRCFHADGRSGSDVTFVVYHQ